MKIGYCLSNHKDGGGVMRVTASKINALVERGYEVAVIVNYLSDQDPFFALDHRVQVISLDINPFIYKDSLYKRLIYAIKRMFLYKSAMTKVLKQESFHILLVHNRLEVLLLPFIKDNSIKILEHHGPKTEYQNIQTGRKTNFLHKCLTSFYEVRDHVFGSLFDKMVVLTEQDKVLRGNSNKIDVIPNLTSFKEQSFPIDNKTLTKNVIAVGRFTEEKDFSTLLDIWAIVVKACPDWQLNIVGDGYLREQIEAKRKKLNLQNSVSLLGERKDVEKLYMESAIYVMTSRYEGFGMVLVEAQHFGLPCISFDCPCGPRSIINNNIDGFLVTPEDKDTFAKRLIQLIQDEDLRLQMGAKAKESAKRFEGATIIPKWEALFNELINSKNGK